MLDKLQSIAKHPLINILLAFAICLASGAEILKEYIEETSELGAHHGVGLYGLVLLFRSVLELVTASGELAKGVQNL